MEWRCHQISPCLATVYCRTECGDSVKNVHGSQLSLKGGQKSVLFLRDLLCVVLFLRCLWTCQSLLHISGHLEGWYSIDRTTFLLEEAVHAKWKIALGLWNSHGSPPRNPGDFSSIEGLETTIWDNMLWKHYCFQASCLGSPGPQLYLDPRAASMGEECQQPSTRDQARPPGKAGGGPVKPKPWGQRVGLGVILQIPPALLGS